MDRSVGILVSLVLAAGVGSAQVNEPLSTALQEAAQAQARGDAEGAVAAYERALEACETEAERVSVLFRLAPQLVVLGKDDQAQQALDEALTISPKDPRGGSVLLQLMSSYMRHGENAKAIAAGRRVAADYADEPALAATAHLRLSLAHQAEGEIDEAIAECKAIMEVHKEGTWREQAVQRLILLYLENGQARAAAELAKQELAARPDNASIAVQIGNAYAAEGKTEEALSVLRKALEANPDSSVVAQRLYQISDGAGRLEEHLEYLEGQVRQAPESAAWYMRLADAYGWAGRREEAAETLEWLAERTPEDAVVHLRLGSMYERLGRLEEARATYERAAELRPEDLGTQSVLGGVYAALGETEKALAAWKKAIRYDPEDSNSVLRLARMLYQRSLYEEAEDVLRDGRQRLGSDTLFAADMGRVLEAKLDFEGALREYLSAVAAGVQPEPNLSSPASSAVELALAEGKARFLAREAARLREQHPDNAELTIVLWRAYLADDRLAEAAKLVADNQDLFAAATAYLAQMASQLLMRGEAEAAAQIYEVMKTAPPDDWQLEIAAVGLARAKAAMGDWAGAAEELEEYVRKTGVEAAGAEVRLELADIYLRRTRDIPRAHRIYLDLLALPHDTGRRYEVLRGLADCLFARGDYEAAQASYETLEEPLPAFMRPPPSPFGPPVGMVPQPMLMRSPRSGYPEFMLAECAFRLGSYKEAEALFKRFAAEYPQSQYANDALARANLLATDVALDPSGTGKYLAALGRSERGDYDAAAAALEGMVRNRPEAPMADDALLLLGSVLEQGGQPGQSLARYEQLLEAYPESVLRPEAMLAAGRVCAQMLEEPDRARQFYRDVVQQYPDTPMAVEARQRLEDLAPGV
ncbi:MAG: tetratricopeptide repeat protein [Armatimonadota bacterium]